ncbi:Heme O synthase, protoheme IX farnesyltransferase COX10-CtaB [hydrothermal vent metagenome]|uniref:Protoheme IX farnesyltransferase n=1 Tax=hydrothermal vent metagenome TaxID=652676 RepID=A0A3B1B436_9ZZZZ
MTEQVDKPAETLANETASNSVGWSIDWRDYYDLCKPKVVGLIIFTAIVGMLLAVPGLPDIAAFIYGILGIGLASASAAAINQIVDQKVDADMQRTQQRPIPQGNLSNRHALIFAFTIGTIAMLILVFLVNILTAVLTFLSLIGYAVIYTMFLKRATPQNIVIGGAAGAAPPVLGWTAMTGAIDPNSLWLFLIIFAWTPPHFWALAIHRRDEYAKVDIPMLPVTHGVDFTRLHVLLYTIILIIVTIFPYLVQMTGEVYLLAVLVLDGIFLFYVLKLQKSLKDGIAMKTFGFSIIYLMLLFAVLLIDHYIPYTN